MTHNKIQLSVPDSRLVKEYELGMSLYKLAKKYNTRYGVIRTRIINSGIKLRKLKIDKRFSESEDNIIIFLRNNEYSIREISKGLYNRSFKSVAGRLVLLKRDRKVI